VSDNGTCSACGELNDHNADSRLCVMAQRDALRARVAELEAALRDLLVPDACITEPMCGNCRWCNARRALTGAAQPRGDTVSCPKHGRKELREDGDTYFCPECEGKP
jgi:hypothetical protein